MFGDDPMSRAAFWWRPLIPILVSFPIALFTAALVTDIAYAESANMMWADFSDWLLAGGILVGAVAAIAGLADLIVHRHIRAWRRIWPVACGCALVLIAALLDNFVHSRDAWTSIVPLGLALSAVTVALTLVTAWFGFAMPLTVEDDLAAVTPRRREVRA